MIIAVASFSAIPVLFKLGGAEESPFLFTGIWQVSIAIGVGAAIPLFGKKMSFKKAVVKDITSQCGTWLMLFSLIGHCGFALFALGLAFIDVSLAAILYEIWPIFLIFLMSHLFKGTKRYRPITWGTWIFVFMAVLGVTLVVLSHNVAPRPLLEIRSGFTGPGTLLGGALIILTAISQAMLAAGTLKIGILLAKNHPHPESRETGEIVFTMVMNCICLVIGGGVLIVIGIILSETMSAHQLLYAILSGIFVTPIGTVAFRFANLKTDDLGVNAIAFATPLVALGWLWAFSILGVSHLDYLIIGAMGVVAANLLINTKADKRIAYNALVVCLWLFGTIIYFHLGYETEVPLELPVTVFILVLSFRVDRLVRRTSQEEAWVFNAFHRLRLMASKRQIDYAAGEILLKIDRHKTPEELAGAYRKLVEKLALAERKVDNKDEITEVRHMVDSLAHSRQQGAHFGELVAIAIAGGLIVVGLLFFNGKHDIYSDLASFLLSSVVVFLFFNIVDLQNDRRDPILIGRIWRYEVKFDDAVSKYGQQKFSVVISAVIVVVFAVLFTGVFKSI